MAKVLGRTEVALSREQGETEAALSRERREEVFAKSAAALETLERALDDLDASLSEAEAKAAGLMAKSVDRLLLAGALNSRIAEAKMRLDEGRTALRGADIPKVVGAGRQAHDEADLLAKVAKVVGLIGKLTSARHDTNDESDRHYRDFESLLANEYRDFASRENYPEEAIAYADLQRFFARLSELRTAPRLANRNICAVAGGFSSGKSSFLNMLIGKRILPTDITPTTSIPTYIFHVDGFHVDGESRIVAFNHHGGHVKVDAEFKYMTHDFKKRHNVEVKRLVHRVSIYTQALSNWKNLAFIDTPGYSNPEEGRPGVEQRDEDIALANVLKAEFLIWVVDCEKGTLPEQDIHFIRQFVEERSGDAESKLYLVLNKGDHKSEQARQDILQVAEKTAKANEIPFAGIGICSARQKDWYAHQGLSFEEFLQTVDQAQSSATIGLEGAVEEVFQRYINYHHEQEEQLGAAVGLLNRLDGLTSGEKINPDVKQRCTYIRNARSDHKKLRDEAQYLQTRFAAAVEGFVEGINAA